MTAFVVRGLVNRGLLVDLSANPAGTLHHPGQVAEVCAGEDPADLVAADTPLRPERAAARLRVRRVESGWPVRLGTVDGHPLPTAARSPAVTGGRCLFRCRRR